ncbi:MAG: PAC2 family protein [Candidatus ainarchaeum sp.]|nr:PAC2 family protein [Candidatus ainarchaeum sp.]
MAVISNVKNVKLNNPTLLIGLPGIGLVGKIAIDFIAEKMKNEKIGSIYSTYFTPAGITYKGQIDLIKDEFSIIKTKKKDFILLTGIAQPALFENINPEAHFEFAKKIVEIAKELGVKEIYTFGGLDISDARITKNPELYFVTTNTKKKEPSKYAKLLQDEITISGVAGLTLGFAKEEGMQGYCILAETTSKLIYGDFEAAKKMLEFISKYFELKVDLKDIDKEAKKISKAFKEVQTALKQLSKDEASDVKPSYVR